MTDLPDEGVVIARPKPDDHDAWAKLYEGYAKFYEVAITADRLETVWSWIHDPSHELDAFVARRGPILVGLAHFRPFVRPLRGERALFLDDLFVEPGSRTRGIGTALLCAIKDEAHRRGCAIVRWVTADDNYRARSLYDQHAVRTMWITYDMPVSPAI